MKIRIMEGMSPALSQALTMWLPQNERHLRKAACGSSSASAGGASATARPFGLARGGDLDLVGGMARSSGSATSATSRQRSTADGDAEK